MIIIIANIIIYIADSNNTIANNYILIAISMIQTIIHKISFVITKTHSKCSNSD